MSFKDEVARAGERSQHIQDARSSDLARATADAARQWDACANISQWLWRNRLETLPARSYEATDGSRHHRSAEYATLDVPCREPGAIRLVVEGRASAPSKPGVVIDYFIAGRDGTGSYVAHWSLSELNGLYPEHEAAQDLRFFELLALFPYDSIMESFAALLRQHGVDPSRL